MPSAPARCWSAAGLVGTLAMGLALLPRSTRELARLEEEPVDSPLVPVGAP